MPLNPVHDIFDPVTFAAPKPFACGELATPGDIDNPDFPGNPTKRVSTSHFYNNYDISHHNEIWGSAFTGDYHGGFTWYPYVAHRYLNATPKPLEIQSNGSQRPRNLGESFTFRDILDQTVDINGNVITSGSTDVIKSTYHNFKPLADFFNTISGNGISLNNFWEDHHIYDDIQNVECYYQTEGTGDHAIGWIHNINFYWANKYYYWADKDNFIAYYNLNGCNPSSINQGLEIDWLLPNQNYNFDFYFTRMATPPPNFPSSVIVQADVNGKVTLDASVFGTWLGCDTMTADLAFVATRLPNRSNSDQFTEIQPMDSKSISCKIYLNPSQGIFDVMVKFKDRSTGIWPVVSLFDMAGRMLDKKQMSGSREHFDFSSIEKGCYLVEVNYGKQKLYKKIIIQ